MESKALALGKPVLRLRFRTPTYISKAEALELQRTSLALELQRTSFRSHHNLFRASSSDLVEQ